MASISLHLMNYMGYVAFIRKHLRLKETPQEILLDLDVKVTSRDSMTSISLHLMNYLHPQTPVT